MRLPLTSFVMVFLLAVPALGKDPTRIFPRDSRFDLKTLNDYFPFNPPQSKGAWEARKQDVRTQLLVATGLWPMPEKAPLNPVIHGKIDRDDYTVEKVYFTSYPGHLVCGNLYRPKGKNGKLAGVLCPHGHWRNGRFFDAGEKEAQNQIKQGAEKTVEGARYPLQARCAQLARMGCVVFHYDMVGNADSQQIAHAAGFTDAEADLRLQSAMGLQTYNSIRALDFLLGLPDVDSSRIGVTGASGGGTQTFMLCGIDDRPAAAFPAVMVSTGMQGGCVCENCSYLRQDTGNVEFAGLFAPKPLAMSGANDWTIDIEKKGLPELKALYRLYDAEDRVMAKCYPQFLHNYNQVARELMYNWFNKHLQLGQPEPVVERPFTPVPTKELTVFDAEHPRPTGGSAAELRKHLTEAADKQLAAVAPKDAKALEAFRKVVGPALRVMLHTSLPTAAEVQSRVVGRETADGYTVQKAVLGRKGRDEQVPTATIAPPSPNGTVVVWVDPAGKSSLFANGKLNPTARMLLDKKVTIVAPDVFFTGESLGAPPAVNPKYSGYTYGYNRPVLANRVHDILTAVAFAKHQPGVKQVHLLGQGKAGPWVALARTQCGDAVARTAADLDRFTFKDVQKTDDERMLPGGLKYGDLSGLIALCAPGELFVHQMADGADGTLKQAYRSANGAGRLRAEAGKATDKTVAEWLVRP